METKYVLKCYLSSENLFEAAFSYCIFWWYYI